MSTGSPWWAPFSSPAEFHHHQQEQQRRQREHERWWTSLTDKQRAEILQQRAGEQAAARRRQDEERRAAAEADRLLAEQVQAARDSISASVGILNAVGAPGAIEVRAAHADFWPSRIGRGWLVGELRIWYPGSGPSGMSPGQEASTSTFEMLVTTQARWILVEPLSRRRSRRKGRRYGTHFDTGEIRSRAASPNAHEQRVQANFDSALPGYAAELARLASAGDR